VLTREGGGLKISLFSHFPAPPRILSPGVNGVNICTEI